MVGKVVTILTITIIGLLGCESVMGGGDSPNIEVYPASYSSPEVVVGKINLVMDRIPLMQGAYESMDGSVRSAGWRILDSEEGRVAIDFGSDIDPKGKAWLVLVR